MRRSPSSTFAEYLAAIHGRLRPRYRPEDVYLGNLLGRLEALNPGVTTMLDWFYCAQSPEHADASPGAAEHLSHELIVRLQARPPGPPSMPRARRWQRRSRLPRPARRMRGPAGA